MSNPFSQNDPEENKLYKKMIMGCIVAASLIVLLFLVVLYENSKDKSKAETNDNENASGEPAESDFVYGESNLTSQDLDFWDMYDNDDEEIIEEDDEEDKSTPYKKNDDKKNKDDKGTEKTSDTDDKDNENRLAVKDGNGETIWYEILSSVKKNNYAFENNLTTDDKNRLKYDKEGNVTRTGIDISKDTDIPDFSVVKADGVDFVMVRVALRGYSTGALTLDDKFVDYITGATNNGMYVGAYIDSQAINEQEAIEEANFLVGAIGNMGVKYPLAINFAIGSVEKGRADDLSMKERTAVAKAFCDTIKQYGHNPAIRGTRDFLISKLNLEDLNDYDIWVSDFSNPTDYPYNFSMWRYSDSLNIEGVSGKYAVDLSFVKFEEK